MALSRGIARVFAKTKHSTGIAFVADEKRKNRDRTIQFYESPIAIDR